MERRSRVVVVVSYFRDGSFYPRSGQRDEQGHVYWSNIAVNAATLRHVAGPAAEFVVCAGDEPPTAAAELLGRAGATVRHLAFTRRPPDDFYVRYLGSLYVLDVMAAMSGELDDDDIAVFVDPDVVWVRPLDPLLDEVRRGGIVAYDLDVPDSVPMCGLTRRQHAEVLAEMSGAPRPAPDDPSPRYFGGEHYAMLGSELRTLVPQLEALWASTLRRYEEGLSHFNVEEHLVNAAMWQRGEQVGRAGRYIQRIRTLPRPMGTRERAHPDLVAWHLPLEKDKAFLALFRDLTAGFEMPPSGPDYQRWLSRRMGVAPVGLHWTADRLRQVKWVVTGRSLRDLGNRAAHGL